MNLSDPAAVSFEGHMLSVVASAALIDANGHILLAQRPEGKSYAGWWELPGGKLEFGELPAEALTREIQEELGVFVNPTDWSPLTFVAQATPTCQHRHWC